MLEGKFLIQKKLDPGISLSNSRLRVEVFSYPKTSIGSKMSLGNGDPKVKRGGSFMILKVNIFFTLLRIVISTVSH